MLSSMCIFMDHDVQLVIDLSAIQVRTHLLFMTMMGTVLIIISNVFVYNNTAVHFHQHN